MWELAISKQSFSKNIASGICVVKSLFETASAPVLSDKVGILIGIREPEMSALQ